MWNNFTNSIFEANQTGGETLSLPTPTWKGRNETRREHQISSCTQEDCEWCSQANGCDSTAGIEQHANLRKCKLISASQLHISRKNVLWIFPWPLQAFKKHSKWSVLKHWSSPRVHSGASWISRLFPWMHQIAPPPCIASTWRESNRWPRQFLAKLLWIEFLAAF